MQSLHINALKVRNYRCFERLEIAFHPQLTVLVAENGAGKTAILDAVAVALGPYVGAFDEAVGKNFSAADIRMLRVRETLSHEMEYASGGVELEVEGCIPPLPDGSNHLQPVVWRRALSGPKKTKTTIKDAKQLISYGKRMQESARQSGTDVVLPLVAYYGTGRLWQQKKLTETKKIMNTSRTIGYTDCFDPASSYKSFEQWFRYWSLNAATARIKASEQGVAFWESEFDGYIESVASAVNICLRLAGWRNVSYSFSREALVAYHDELGELPVEQLSDGIRNMIGLVADIAFRATKLNGHLGRDASRLTPGIVLIDEVDMHLHPGWQQTVLADLLLAFPGMQFIVTTHSPQVLSSVDCTSIRVLRKSTVDEGELAGWVDTVDMQTKGVSSADVLAEIMHVAPVPDVAEARMLDDYHALIEQNLHTHPDALALREQLNAHFGSDHPLMHECDRLIRLQSYKQRQPLRNNGNEQLDA
ncbi:MAG: ATP-binding protein [Candidatus Kapabacteria bacterium]|nr:ATP-binding protein [Candidatus Kapabacteria bacterium]